jgi:hypothetical protein
MEQIEEVVQNLRDERSVTIFFPNPTREGKLSPSHTMQRTLKLTEITALSLFSLVVEGFRHWP